MPQYEFYCHACNEIFTKKLTRRLQGRQHPLPLLRQPKGRAMLVCLLRYYFKEKRVRTAPTEYAKLQ